MESNMIDKLAQAIAALNEQSAIILKLTQINRESYMNADERIVKLQKRVDELEARLAKQDQAKEEQKAEEMYKYYTGEELDF